MKNWVVYAFFMFIIVAGCCKDPGTKVVRVPYDTCLTDSPKLDSILNIIDSVYDSRESHLDSLKQAAMDEVTDYREASIYQIDTMRANFLTWMDSLKGTKIFDNMIIHGDSLKDVNAKFDSATGKPYLEMQN